MKSFHDDLTKKREVNRSPFQSPGANPKRAFDQVNGETQQTLSERILEVQARKRN
ncbi:YpzG-like protein [Melghiribacillus thermohalophilus]|uniref:YpzG-like protein n=1 Tax=Melghiribacillus thermohalophilus TaxID=1324956 RepID=A0A4R3MSA9_9BACI|nr:YpzG family protein [Melghiribacillus thermohalophilus]TCT17951.1 YpzG-like protein [Melghiribacillus thermohalophilus]